PHLAATAAAIVLTVLHVVAVTTGPPAVGPSAAARAERPGGGPAARERPSGRRGASPDALSSAGPSGPSARDADDPRDPQRLQ
ncbi:MAG: hypothetical protein KF764_04400, partial [Labilithrix sp.]|nr:hypothetical protein [Labilithrix sp.]